MKFIIRSCDARLWYVKNYLIPELKRQGIPDDDIILKNDDDHIGCLKGWLRVCDFVVNELSNEIGVWYLQDDILPSDNFFETAKDIPRNIICNGFASFALEPDDVYKVGYVSVKNYWMSFPCVYIPSKYIKGFLGWFNKNVVNEQKYQKEVNANKYEDKLFWQFIKERYPDDYCLNIVPNMIQHIDYMLGGSTINTHWKAGKLCSFYWDEYDKENELQRRLNNDSKNMLY